MLEGKQRYTLDCGSMEKVQELADWRVEFEASHTTLLNSQTPLLHIPSNTVANLRFHCMDFSNISTSADHIQSVCMKGLETEVEFVEVRSLLLKAYWGFTAFQSYAT